MAAIPEGLKQYRDREFGCHVRPRVNMFFACAVILFFASSVNAINTPAIVIEQLDSSTMTVEKLITADADHVVFQSTGNRHEVNWDELSRISFPSDPKPPIAPMTFSLHPEGRLFGTIVEQSQDGVIAQTALTDRTLLPFKQLAAIRLTDDKGFAKADELFTKALEERLIGKDVLITRSTTDVRTMRGRLDSLGPSEGIFSLGEKSRSFGVDKAYGVVFARELGDLSNHRFTCHLADGSFFRGTLIRANETTLTFSTAFEKEITLPISTIAALDIQSSRVTHLTDLKPVNESSNGILQTPWPACIGCNVAGGPIRMLQKEYRRGIGVRSRSELTFDIDPGHESFAATIGIDDSVRPRGSVVFRILGQRPVSKPAHAAKPNSDSNIDDRVKLPALFPTEQPDEKSPAASIPLDPPQTLFDSGTITGADPPRDISVPINGMVRLTLVVDYGDGLDWSDRANWANARLLRPASTATKP